MKSSIIFSENEIQKKVSELALQINDFYGSKEILAIGILNGVFIFYSDLLKHLTHNIACDFCSISYYGSSNKALSEATIDLDITQEIRGKNVLLIDCIIDYGYTIEFAKKHIQQRNPTSIHTVGLVIKPAAHKNTKIDFSGFEVEQDVFVVGYGTDYQNQGRNLPHFAQVVELN